MLERKRSLGMVGAKASGTKTHKIEHDPVTGNVMGMTSEEDQKVPDLFGSDMAPDDLGLPGFGVKSKKVRKVHKFIRHPETGDVMGMTTDEVDVPDEGAGPTDALPNLDSTNEIAPGVQASGLPTPASQIAPEESGGHLNINPAVVPMDKGGLP